MEANRRYTSLRPVAAGVMGFLLVQIIGGLIADSCDEDHTIFVRGHVGAKGCGSSDLKIP